MIESAVPALFVLAGNGAAGLHSNYQVMSTSYPAAAGETISLFATDLGAFTQQGNLQVVNATPQVGSLWRIAGAARIQCNMRNAWRSAVFRRPACVPAVAGISDVFSAITSDPTLLMAVAAFGVAALVAGLS
jgi:hypothetical protein